MSFGSISLAPSPRQDQLAQPDAAHVSVATPDGTSSYSPAEQLSGVEIAEVWERLGAVKDMPQFEDQVADLSRQAQFRHEIPLPPRAKRAPEVALATEHDALQELQGVLARYVARGVGQNTKPRDVGRAIDALKNLTFIGAPEYTEAARGIGTAWKNYLDSDPRRKLYVLTHAGQLPKYEGLPKSDEYLKQQILSTFSDEDLKRYSGRLIDGLPDVMGADVEHVRAVMLDDWTISTRQMRSVYEHLMQSQVFRELANAGRVEVNVIVAPTERIQQGLIFETANGSDAKVPLRAYYRAHYAPTAPSIGHSLITGLHSTVNYGFGALCEKVASPEERRQGVPKLANVLPPYRDLAVSASLSLRRLHRYVQAHSLAAREAAR